MPASAARRLRACRRVRTGASYPVNPDGPRATFRGGNSYRADADREPAAVVVGPSGGELSEDEPIPRARSSSEKYHSSPRHTSGRARNTSEAIGVGPDGDQHLDSHSSKVAAQAARSISGRLRAHDRTGAAQAKVAEASVRPVAIPDVNASVPLPGRDAGLRRRVTERPERCRKEVAGDSAGAVLLRRRCECGADDARDDRDRSGASALPARRGLPLRPDRLQGAC
jgi:hypothetical protein